VSSGNNSTTGTAVTVYAAESGTIAENLSVGSAANYTSTLTCTGNHTPLVGNTLTINPADTAIACIQTNARKTVTLTLAKKWVTSLVGDSMTVTTTGGTANAAISNNAPGGNGAGTTTAGGTPVTVHAGDVITLSDETGTVANPNSTFYTDYPLDSIAPARFITCTDPVAGALVTNVPVQGAGNSAVGSSLTVPANATAITCTYTNTHSITLQLAKVWGAHSYASDQATIGATIGGSTTDGTPSNTNSFSTMGGTPAVSNVVPIIVLHTITLPAETFSPASAAQYYNTTVSCFRSDTGAPVTGSSAPTNAANGQLSGTVKFSGLQIARPYTCTYTNTPKTVPLTLKKVWVNGATGDTATVTSSGFANTATTGVSVSSGNNTTTGTAAQVAPGESGTISESFSVGSATNYTTSLACSGNATPLVGNTLTVTRGDSAIVCTMINTYNANLASVAGKVFLDTGAGAGTANDGIINGGEAGLSGIAVKLTNCAGTTIVSTLTDGTGAYNLAVPVATASGSALCVEETNNAGQISTGASVGNTALPSGTATSAGGTNYTYTRTGTPDRIAFTWDGASHSDLDFGDVPNSTFGANGGKNGLPNSSVTYPHTFIAGTGGTVVFTAPSDISTPNLAGWSYKIYADPTCSGTLQTGATLLYPPVGTGQTVSAGQNVCIIVQEYIPAAAVSGSTDNVNVSANFTYSNANPSLSSTYVLNDVTMVSSSALDLVKQVRNVTTGGTFGLNNQAKSGDILEYQITYTNNATTPITSLVINDATPAYTSFISQTAGTTPASLTACTKTAPGNTAVACSAAQTPGGSGSLSWSFTGPLNPGATGSVTFQVKVQ
jgi:uncharacterized repeat protein (TIGR01451 family)